MSVARPVGEVWQLACDPKAWPPMPGAPFVLQLRVAESPSRIRYAITEGLPVIEHRGELVLTATPSGGTELVFGESFRPRIWGTGGYLRGRRERALVDTARAWERGGRDSGHSAPEGDT